ncbi:DNA modification system-associated small protein [Candidatus Parabeggiatoa sp. HSG14]|uniref:DNA modification system-associated small protein n=1 Tax=Candidatus Parabeggiatoa sp. HSG14 TaxID=3055593 RepID=UPI0025A7CA26|nr:hypothetical protein [Thiotrichales bacterium HSG14]
MLHSIGDLPLWSDKKAYQILENICKEEHIPIVVLQELVALERKRLGETRRHKINDEIDKILERNPSIS